MSNKRIVVVGSSNVIFTYSYIMSLSEVSKIVGYVDVGVSDIELPENIRNIPRFKTNNNNSKVSVKTYAKRILKKLRLDRNKYILSVINKLEISNARRKNPDLVKFIKSTEPDHIIYIWSTTVKKIKNEIALIINEHDIECSQSLIVNTYPVRSNIQYDDYNPEARHDSLYFNSFDKLILTSELMKKYFIDRLQVSKSKVILHQDKLHLSFFDYNKDYKPSIEEIKSKVVFLGNTKFNERTIDDVSKIIKQLAAEGVEVWIQNNGEKIEHDNIKYFVPFSYQEMLEGKLSTFVSQFDAVIMLYNDLENLRSNISYPTRFAMGTLGLIPILIKSNQFKAIEELYEKNNTVVLFDSYIELAEICKNKQLLSERTELIRNNTSEVMETRISALEFVNKLYET